MIKACFDLYLPDLCKKLGYWGPIAHDERKRFWIRYSQAITYRVADSLDELGCFCDQDSSKGD